MKQVKTSYIAVFIFVLIIVGYIVLNSQNSMTVVSSSSISYDSQLNKWISTNIVVNGNDSLQFSKSSLYDSSIADPSIQSVQAQKGFTLKTEAKQPYCSYNLAWSTYPLQSFLGIPINAVPYATLGAKTQHAPYTVSVLRDGGDIDSQNLDASILGTNQVNFFGGQVTVQNLGQLNNGVTCPDSSGAVLLPVYNSSGGAVTKWTLASASDWDAYKRRVTVDYAGCLLTFPPIVGCANQVLQNLAQPQVAKPYAFSQFESMNIDTISQGATNLIGYLPIGSSYANVVVQVDSKFVDTLIVQKPNGKPQVTLTWDRTSFKQGENAILTVNVKNAGTSADNFQINLSTNGSVNFTPQANQTGTIQQGASVSKDFAVYALGSGTPSVLVSVQAIGSGAVDQKTQMLSISSSNLPQEPEPQPIEVCGNGKCLNGETKASCPQDCGTIETSVCGNGKCEAGEQLTCANDCTSTSINTEKDLCLSKKTDLLIVNWNYKPATLLTGSECKPEYNLVLIIGIVAVILVGGAIVFVQLNKKKRR